MVAFRKEECTLAHLLDVFVYDPLVEWTLSESKDFQNKKHNDLKLSLDYISTHFTNTVKARRELHNKYRESFLHLTRCYRDLKVFDAFEEIEDNLMVSFLFLLYKKIKISKKKLHPNVNYKQELPQENQR